MARGSHHFMGHPHAFQTCLLPTQGFSAWCSCPGPAGLCWWEGMKVPKPFGVAVCWQHQQHQAHVTTLLYPVVPCPLSP